MKKYFYIGLTIILLLAVSIIAWGTYLNLRGENIIATRMDNRKLNLRGQKAQMRDIHLMVTMDTVNLTAENMADAIALIDGRIVSSSIKPHDKVSAGQVLFELVNDEIPMKLKQADSGILQAQAELTRAQNTYNRHARLMELNATSLEQLDEAEARYHAAQGKYDEAEALKQQTVMRESRQTVTAPIDGEVVLMYRQPGTYVQANTSIALIGNFDKLTFSRQLKNDFFTIMNRNTSYEFEMELTDRNITKVYDSGFSAGNVGLKERFHTRVVKITPDPSEPADVRTIQFEVDNTAGILEPQTYHQVNLYSTQSKQCLAIPLSALSTDSRDSVYVLNEAGTIEKRAIVTGVEDDRHVEIVQGLEAGDTVITSDLDTVTEGMAAKVQMEEDEA